jgi:uncharacterized membrane protein YecN with MAPEG domain
MIAPYVTSIYAALLGLLAAFLAVNVIRNRVGLKVESGDGGNDTMRMAIRAHGNFAEYVPLALILIAMVEGFGMSRMIVHGLGAALLLARVLSAWGLSHALGPSFGRQAGASITILVLVVASVLILLRAAGIV